MRLQVLGTLAIILGCLALGVDVYLDRVILEFYVPTVPGRHGIHASDAIGSTLVIAGLVALCDRRAASFKAIEEWPESLHDRTFCRRDSKGRPLRDT